MSLLSNLTNPIFSENYEFGFPGIKGKSKMVIVFRPNEVEIKRIKAINQRYSNRLKIYFNEYLIAIR